MLRQYFPGFLDWLKTVRDPRKRPDQCTFPIEYLLMLVLVMHCGQCGSRRQLGRQLLGGRIRGNIWRMVGRAVEEVACHTDTMNGVMEALDPEQLETLIAAVFGRLRHLRVLDRFRFDGQLTAAIDATRMLSFKKEHCKHCTRQTQNGVTTWFHNVLVAKIVTPLGLVVPLAFEFIENPGGEYVKQDCELKAWRRLQEKIVGLYPRLRLNVVGDGLYADETTMADCDRLGWNFAITLTEDKLPTVTAQLPPAVGQWSGTRTCSVNIGGTDALGRHRGRPRTLQRTVRWKTPLRYHDEVRHVIELEDTDEKGERVYYNRWITNVKPDRQNAFDLALTGRLRWKVENEGTNTQKNGGYEMEHAYGRNQNAWKNYYLLLQVSQLMNDLVRFTDILQKTTGDPAASFAVLFGTMGNFAACLLASLNTGVPDMNGPTTLARRIQIRLLRC